MIRITDAAVQPFETEHMETVRTLAPECTVLLKNEGVLPLKEAGKLALYGSGARRTIKGGTGSGDVNVRHFVTVEEGLANAGFTVTSGAWLDSYEEVAEKARKVWIQDIKDQAAALGTEPVLYSMGKIMPQPEYELPLDGEGDTAVYVLSRISGEGSDRTDAAGDISLTQTEIRDIRMAYQKYEKFILVLNVGGMVDLSPVADVECILLLGQLGTPTGDVCADILLGKANPSGKLAMTWAPLDAYPSTEGFGDFNDTRYTEGIYVGYRYFDSFGKKPIYPFGYGLSYTTFELTALGAASEEDSQIAVTAVVKNTGKCAGKETVQVYVSAPQGMLDRPQKELKAFAKTAELAPGQSEALTMRIALKDLAGYDEESACWLLEKGDYVVRVGTSSADTQPACILSLNDSVIVEQAHSVFPGCDFADRKPDYAKSEGNVSKAADAEQLPDVPVLAISAFDIAADNILGTLGEIPDFAPGASDEKPAEGAAADSAADAANEASGMVSDAAAGAALGAGAASDAAADIRTAADAGAANDALTAAEDAVVAFGAGAGRENLWAGVKDGSRTIEEYMEELTTDELIDICIGEYEDGIAGGSIIGNASFLIPGGAGDTTHRASGAGLEVLTMADGPAGLRVSRQYKLVNGKIKSLDSSMAGIEDFLDARQLALLAKLNAPTPEEEKAPVNYQYCIAIPIGTALAQSFNVELCAALGDMVGEEMELFGVNYWLAPALNIQRNPLCGRNFEYYSEDPVVSGKIAAAITKGVQTHKGCGTTIKHFAANNQETNRYGSNSIVSERALREIYLKGFEIAVKESAPEAIMTSYNLINGEHSCNRKDLLTTVLRDEWGYEGLVMTDWTITTGGVSDPASLHGPASAAGCVKAGNNVTMPGDPADAEDIRKALADPKHPYALTLDELKACAKPVLEAVLRLK